MAIGPTNYKIAASLGEAAVKQAQVNAQNAERGEAASGVTVALNIKAVWPITLPEGPMFCIKGIDRSWAERQEAERAIWSAPGGVRRVENRISISVYISAKEKNHGYQVVFAQYADVALGEDTDPFLQMRREMNRLSTVSWRV